MKYRTNWIITPDKFFEKTEVLQIREFLLGQNMQARRNQVNLFLFELLLGTGLRASELCSLKVSQTPVVLGVNKIWIKGKAQKTRTVTIRAELAGLIRQYVKQIRPGEGARTLNLRKLCKPGLHAG